MRLATRLLVFFIGLQLANAQAQEPGPAAAAAFDRFGDGDCMTSAMLPVRGRSRRDMEHGACRAVCDTDNCIGYSYAPCERICTLHGEPALFRGLPLPERWSTLNGGGLIASTDLRCGTSCYVRKAPCPGGTLRSAGAFMNYESLTYALSRTLECPFPHKGSVTIVCTSTGVEVQSGRCLRPCDSGLVRDDFFEVKYPPTRHGEFGAGECPTGTLGNMTIFCNDGSATWVLGQCGINCPAGSLRSGSSVVFFPVLDHEERTILDCPSGWTGKVGLECINEDTSLISGGCKRHCAAGILNITVAALPAPPVQGFLSHQALEHGRGKRSDCQSDDDMLTGGLILFCNDGNVTPDYTLSGGPCRRHCAPGYIGTGMRGVSYGKIPHGQNQTLQCNPGYDGYFLIQCVDGEVIHLEGMCHMDCIVGTITSNTITLPHVAMKHGENTTVECPIETHTGNITVLCDDGQAKMVEGFCGLNCSAGSIRSNGALVRYPGIPHYERLNISCPAPWGDMIEFRCYDGSIRFDGVCGRQCPGGRLSNNGATVFYGNLNHSEVANFSCETLFQSELTFSGQLEVACWDGRVSSTGGQCFPDCSRGEINNNGARILVPPLLAGESILTHCEPSQAYGMVTVSCLEGFQRVTSGSCGDPCPAGPFSNVNTRHTPIELEEVWHDTGVWKDCPLDLSGRVYINCFDRILRVLEGQCGERCPAQQITMSGGNFNSPRLDHAETFLQPCLEPYSSHINLTCHFGDLSVTSNCQLGCFAGSFTLPNGALVSHPNLVSGQTSSPACPPGFVGEVSVICVNGTMERDTGACHAHCSAGRFRGPTDYAINHEEILYNETSLVSCPIGFLGTLRLRCLGTVVIDSGECMRNCIDGVFRVRDGILMNYQAMEHNQLSNEMICPRGYVGSIRLSCFDGNVGLHSGKCFEHCGSGQVQGASYNDLNHEDYDSIICPEVGQIRIRCFDGETQVLDGECLYGCAGGTSIDPNGVPVQHPAFPHDTRANGTCSQSGVGQVELYCNNMKVSLVSTSRSCDRHCEPQITVSRDGSNISAPYIEHLQTASQQCPNSIPGLLALRCQDNVTTIFDGICGDMNCRAGTVFSNGAEILHPAINDKRRAGPGTCGADYLGEPVFECNDGNTTVLTVNLIRQPRIPGVDNVSEIGSEYNFTEDDRFKLCGCCLPPPPLPDVDALKGLDSLVVIYWAVAVGGAGLLVAFASGYWIHHQSKKKKLSQVAPAATGEVEDQLALPENSFDNNQLALRDAADTLAEPPDPNMDAMVRRPSMDGRQSSQISLAQSLPSEAPRPQILKPRRDGTNKEWQYW